MKNLLTGTFLRSLDEKQRLAIPKRLRESLVTPSNTAVYIAPGTDGSLSLYASESFAKLAEQLDHSSPTGQDVRAFSRLFYAQAQCVEVDRQGRVRVPAELAPGAGLQKEVVLIGVRDHLEIWDRERWETYFSDKQQRYDEIAESAFAPLTNPTMTSANHDSLNEEKSMPAQPR